MKRPNFKNGKDFQTFHQLKGICKTNEPHEKTLHLISKQEMQTKIRRQHYTVICMSKMENIILSANKNVEVLTFLHPVSGNPKWSICSAKHLAVSENVHHTYAI